MEVRVIGYLHTAPALLIGNEAKIFDTLVNFYGRLSEGIVEQNQFSAVLSYSIICCITDLKNKKAAVR
jgi:hypothetical protein